MNTWMRRMRSPSRSNTSASGVGCGWPVDLDRLGELDHGDSLVGRIRHTVDAHLVAGQPRHQVGDERDVVGLATVCVTPGPHTFEAVVGKTRGERGPVVADDRVQVPLDDAGHGYQRGPARVTASARSSRYLARGTSTAPSDVSAASSTARRAATRRRHAAASTSAASATFPASVTRWNIDSPANSPPIATPYTPPTSAPSGVHASTLCAQPSRCSTVYALTKSSSIQPCGRRRLGARRA